MHLDLVGSLVSHPSLLAAGPLGGGLIWTAVIGLLAGVVAKFLSGDREPTGCLVTSASSARTSLTSSARPSGIISRVKPPGSSPR